VPRTAKDIGTVPEKSRHLGRPGQLAGYDALITALLYTFGLGLVWTFLSWFGGWLAGSARFVAARGGASG
jgi:hypothetical protein